MTRYAPAASDPPQRRSRPVPSIGLDAALDAVRDRGQPLPPEAATGWAADLGPGPGWRFDQVRVHADGPAARAAAALDARAYTVGTHIAFGAGQYRPGTPAGRWLLRHELAHVAQQAAVSMTTPTVSESADPLERHASRLAGGLTGAAGAALTGAASTGAGGATPLVQRCGTDHDCGCSAEERAEAARTQAARTGSEAVATPDPAGGGPGSAGGLQPLSGELPGAPHACLLDYAMPYSRSGIVRSSSGVVGEQFQVRARWEKSAPFPGESSYCAAECGEYHQFLKGHMRSSANADGHDAEDVSATVFGGAKLSETVFQEDGRNGNAAARYGHRKEKQTMDEDYKPDRARGNEYIGRDFPQVSIGTWADIDLTFRGDIVDTCANTVAASDIWTVRYQGVIRP